MIRKILPLILSTILIITGCSDTKYTEDNKEDIINESKLTYSNLIDNKTQNEINNILVNNNISNSQVDNFLDIVNDYNKKSDLKSLNTSKSEFTSIDTQQVPYDDVTLLELWDPDKIGYTDFNCRLTSFNLFKEYIKSESIFTGDASNLMFDKDAINTNKLCKFNKDDVDKFTNFFAAIDVQNSKDVNRHAKSIIKEWEKRKISFIDNPNISMINVFLHYPDTNNVFIGHSAILVKDKYEYLFVEKYECVKKSL